MQLLTSVVFFQELPEGNWFCCSECENINTTLVNLVARGEENLPNPLLSLIKKKYNNKGLEFGSDIRIKWRLLNWKVGESEETRQLLSKVVAIFHVSVLQYIIYLIFVFKLTT